MKNIENLTIIKGTFECDEAKDILYNIFSSKINFHQLKNFSSLERFGKNDEVAQKRIPELKMELEKLQDIFNEAKALNKRLVVNSEIKISLADD
jgi:hypothetical protein